MARVNIEDCWWTDPRRTALQRLGVDADGVASRAWKLAQDFWKHGRAMVPKELFETLDGAGELLRVGLAEIRESTVYVRGSSAYLEWIAERREAAKRGGKTSAAKRATKRQPKLKQSQPNTNQTQPSASASYSVSSSESKNEESIGVPAVADPATAIATQGRSLGKPEQAQKANSFVAAYVKAYQTRYPGMRPEDLNDGKIRGQILSWVKDYPLDRARDLIQVYFQMDAKWFDTKGYDFVTFRSNLNKIGQALDSGVDPGGAKVDFASMLKDDA